MTFSRELEMWSELGERVVVHDAHGQVKLFCSIFNSSVDEAETQPGPWLVCFHGFPTSSWDWHRLLPLLKTSCPILVFDFPGYGLSDKPQGRNYSLGRQMDVAEALLDHFQIKQMHLLTHDMGNSVACELLRRRERGSYPIELLSLTMLNGGIYMDLHHPLPTQRLLRTPVLGKIVARLSGWTLFRHQYPHVYAQPDSFPAEHYQDQWALLINNQGRKTLADTAGYMRERVRMGEKWTDPLHRFDRPLKLIWGREDPIAVFQIAERVIRERPQTSLVTLEGIGHYPQLEAPQLVAAEISC